jgi:cytochrome c biogenesis protein CcmG/thiol:disulfide interchange protein DsbE
MATDTTSHNEAATESASPRAPLSRRSIAGLLITMVVTGGLLVLLLARLLSASHAAASAPTASLVGHAAPDFTIATWNGGTMPQQVHLADLKGKPVVVNFYASWCDGCNEEQTLLQQTYQKYAAQGVAFVGIAYDDKQADSAAFLQKFGVTYPSGPDANGEIAVSYGVTGVPETFFIDKTGKVADHLNGPITDGQLYRTIEALLK